MTVSDTPPARGGRGPCMSSVLCRSLMPLLDQLDIWIKLNAGGVAPEQAYIRTTKVRTKYARHCHAFLFVYALFPLELYVWSTQSDTCMWGVRFRSFF